MPDPSYTALSVLLDRSGSMRVIRSDAEGGLRSLIEDQVAQPGRATLRLAQFDTEYQVVHASLPVAQVPIPELHPRGMTALLDAWGRAMTEFGEELAALPEEQRPGNVIFVVVTDGAENASQEWSRQQVFDMVREQTDKWGWKFLFVAANQDAVAEGAKYGVPAGQTVTYSHDSGGTQSAFRSTSAVIGRTRSGKGSAFTEAERRAAQQS